MKRQVNYHISYTFEGLTKALHLNEKGVVISNMCYEPSRGTITFLLTQTEFDKGIPRMEVPEGQEAPSLP